MIALLQTNPTRSKKHYSEQFITAETRQFSIILFNIAISLHPCGKKKKKYKNPTELYILAITNQIQLLNTTKHPTLVYKFQRAWNYIMNSVNLNFICKASKINT